MARKGLDKWIDEALTDSMKDPITSLSLVHMRGAIEVEIYTYKITTAGDNQPKKMADLFLDKANTFCQDLSGPQTCQIFAFYGTQEKQATFILKVMPLGTQSNGLNTEAPDAQGERQQHMRHKEFAVEQVFQHQMALNQYTLNLLSNQGTIIEKMGERVSQLMTDNMSAFDAVKGMLMRQIEVDNEREMKKLAFERATKERENWLKMAPPLINRLLGQDLFPQSMEDTALIETIADNLTEEHLSMLQILPEAIRGPLAARIEAHTLKKTKEDAAMKALPQYRGSAEDDVTGGTH